MNWIPAARSRWWWLVTGITWVFVTIMLWLIRFVWFGQTFTVIHALRFTLLAAIITLISSLAGVFGARKLWLCFNLGIIVGLVLMAIASREATGWQDLVSLLELLLTIVAGFVVGLIAECVSWGIRWNKRK